LTELCCSDGCGTASAALQRLISDVSVTPAAAAAAAAADVEKPEVKTRRRQRWRRYANFRFSGSERGKSGS